MKRYLLTALLLAISCASFLPLAAQPKKPSPEQKEQFFLAKMKMVAQELKLTEDQTNQLTPIYRKYNDEMSSIWERNMQKECSMPRSDVKNATNIVNQRINMKIEILKMQKRYYTQFAKVLTADQLLRLEDAERKIQFQIMKRNSKHDRGKRPHRNQPARPDAD